MLQLTTTLNTHFKEMCDSAVALYRVNVSSDAMWDAYMKGFDEDPIFRDPESSEHNCNCCRHFIHHYGNIVAINDDYSITSIWDIDNVPEEYKQSVSNLKELIHSADILNVFVVTRYTLAQSNYGTPKAGMFLLGTPKNVKRYTKEEADKFGVVKPNQVVTFNHLYLDIPAKFILDTSNSVESISGNHKATKEVFKRAMEEFSVDTLELVKDLIEQNSILNGIAHLSKIKAIIPLIQEYKALKDSQKDAWCWKKSYKFQYARFRNELIGTLCINIQNGVDLNEACKSWNIKADPANYMKAASPITKSQIAAAQKFAEENGYIESFTRRCATMEDIEASEILHIHNGDIKPVSIFDSVKATKATGTPDFKNLKTMSIDSFMSTILPKCTSVELYLENRHQNNFVTLITALNKESKHMFKWSNNFSWTYTGNLAGKSEIKQAVKQAGGFVDAPFRFSIMWNEDGRSIVDLDAHANEPGINGKHIFFRSFKKPRITSMGGQLDIDMIRPYNTGVENIYWTNMKKIADGVYRFWVHNYDGGNVSGFKAEICFDTEVYTYEYIGNFRGEVKVADVTIKGGKLVNITHYAPLVNSISNNIYGLDTNEFHQVNLVCLSPNYWQEAVGNKHYFFFLEGCKSPDKLRGFHNEFLNSELREHRKVLDVLAHTMKVESTDGQLSGLGFNATVKDSVILRVKGEVNSIIKVTF